MNTKEVLLKLAMEKEFTKPMFKSTHNSSLSLTKDGFDFLDKFAKSHFSYEITDIRTSDLLNFSKVMTSPYLIEPLKKYNKVDFFRFSHFDINFHSYVVLFDSDFRQIFGSLI